jgi:hypothetical protein
MYCITLLGGMSMSSVSHRVQQQQQLLFQLRQSIMTPHCVHNAQCAQREMLADSVHGVAAAVYSHCNAHCCIVVLLFLTAFLQQQPAPAPVAAPAKGKGKHSSSSSTAKAATAGAAVTAASSSDATAAAVTMSSSEALAQHRERYPQSVAPVLIEAALHYRSKRYDQCLQLLWAAVDTVAALLQKVSCYSC